VRFERRGHRVLARPTPDRRSRWRLCEDPSPIAAVAIPDTVAALEALIRGLDQPPFLIGHSFRGALVQMLPDRGFGAAGVAIDSAPTEGGPGRPRHADPRELPGPAESGQPAPGGRITPEQFHYAFTSTLSGDESATVYDKFEGRDHFTCGAPGWEAVADHALNCAMEHAPLHARRTAADTRR